MWQITKKLWKLSNVAIFTSIDVLICTVCVSEDVYTSALQLFSLWCTLKNFVTSSCTLCLKFEMRQKVTLKLTCQNTIALQLALRITLDRSHNKFKKLSLMTFLLLHIINQLSKPRNSILFNCSPHQWINVCE